MMKFVINCMLNIQTQHKFKYAHQQILFFKLLFNVKLIYSIQVIGPWLGGNWPFFSSVVGQGKGPSGANAPSVHGIKKCLELKPRSDQSNINPDATAATSSSIKQISHNIMFKPTRWMGLNRP
jgi:hypothetical protein